MSTTLLFMLISLIVSISNGEREQVESLVDLGEYPYMAIIGESCGGDDVPEDWYLDEVICQGTLVASTWVLTASRCDTHQQVWETTYYAITGFLTTTNITKANRRAIIEWIPFGEENEISMFMVDDIILCRLESSISGADVVSLPAITWQLGGTFEPSDASLTDCLYVGWKNDTDTLLMKTQVRPLNISEFYNGTKLIGISANLYTYQSQILGGITGGALICNGTQVGIYLSNINNYGVYTKIARYMPWIDNVLKLDSINLQFKIALTNKGNKVSDNGDFLGADNEHNYIEESMLYVDSGSNNFFCLTVATVAVTMNAFFIF